MGECLGFDSSRPDNEVGAGPDVLWKCDLTKVLFGIEAKTDKTGEYYNKADVGQVYNHLQWILDNYSE